MVKEDNDKRQRHFEEHGTSLPRQLDVRARYFPLTPLQKFRSDL